MRKINLYKISFKSRGVKYFINEFSPGDGLGWTDRQNAQLFTANELPQVLDYIIGSGDEDDKNITSAQVETVEVSIAA